MKHSKGKKKSLGLTPKKYELLLTWLDKFPCKEFYGEHGQDCIHCYLTPEDIFKLLTRR